MIVNNIKLKKAKGQITVIDSFVGKGLVEGGHPALP